MTGEFTSRKKTLKLLRCQVVAEGNIVVINEYCKKQGLKFIDVSGERGYYEDEEGNRYYIAGDKTQEN